MYNTILCRSLVAADESFAKQSQQLRFMEANSRNLDSQKCQLPCIGFMKQSEYRNRLDTNGEGLLFFERSY
jgi:hypothetical protein